MTLDESALLMLVREDLREFAGYSSARSHAVTGDIWLNANEAAHNNPADNTGHCRRYPDPQPAELRQTLANLYGCRPEQLLMGRGSDEAIDLLVRALCQPEADAILTTPPVFGMYAVAARLQNARLVEVPLHDMADGFQIDPLEIAEAALQHQVKVVFLCSPLNPTGGLIPLSDIENLATQLRGHALVVVDEAYGEFSSQESAVSLLQRHQNIAVLRTLSKAHGLAAARLGSVIANARLIKILRNCQAPYPLPAPCIAVAEAGLSATALKQTHFYIEEVKQQRHFLLQALATLPNVIRAYPSEGNFILVRFTQPQAAFDALLAAGIVVRDQRQAPQLGNALRITVGTPEQNQKVLEVLREI